MKRETLIGTFAIIMSSIVFALMSFLIKTAPEIDPYKTSLFRFAIGFAILGTAAMANKISLKFVNSKLLFLRGILGGIAIFIFFYSINKIGIGKGTLISYMFPVFAVIVSSIFLKEKVGLYKWLLILTSVLGIFLISFSKINSEFIGFDYNYLIALFGAMMGGCAITVVKKLRENESSYSIYFAQCTMGFWVVLIPANTVPVSIGISGGFILLGIGITATIGQLLMTYSYKYLSVSKGSVLGMLTPVFNVILGIIFFQEKFTIVMAIGMILILTSCTLIGMNKK
ncbi:MAG: DMT family transporter [Deltaproteobacteria bacterium]|nr:DMT family transporter [Deltaproteobacteria bacterium]